MRRGALLFATLLLATPWLASQELQAGFRDLALGMPIEEAKQQLQADPVFTYRGDPDVSFSPATGEPIIETQGNAFVNRAILQFENDLLYSIILHLDPTRLDYYSVFMSLAEQYGEPSRLDPTQAVWSTERVRLSLERPLTVKYLDAERLAELRESFVVEESLESASREAFLEQL